ncbi:Dbl homology domain-containing protein, partial [Filobasidium floriforme]|uniref:Dbl homology domain-containing protein n=1 Tax=Filobasidium floriforme TaxID=5210 RepID=UPI001E8CB380
LAPSWLEQNQEGRPPARWVQNKLFLHQSHAAGFSPSEVTGEDGQVGGDGYFDEEMEEDYDEEEAEEQNEMNFFSPSLLSHVSVQLRDRVERNSHIKGGIPWPKSFTGRDVITTIQSFMPEHTRSSSNDRRFAVTVAHSLQKQLLFVEVDWDDKPLSDSIEDVYQFMNEIEGLLGSTYEFPTGVETMATKCYSPSCQGAGTGGCYSPMCPYKISPETFLSSTKATSTSQSTTSAREPRAQTWSRRVDQVLIDQMSESEKKRQNIIYQAIQAEEQYEADLNAVETLFISPLRLAQPPVIRSLKDLEDLISTLFGNILELRAANTSLLEFFTERQREQGGIISTIGDVYLTAAAEFRNLYPDYIGRLPRAEERLREELANNSNFRFFVDRVVRQNENRRMDIKYLITRPATQLNRYPQILEAILSETSHESPDATFLVEAIKAIRNLSLTAQLKVWQASANREEIPPTEDALVQRERVAHQANMLDKPCTIWELIQGEMTYVADLRVIETVYIDGLRSADEPIVDRLRLEIFLDDVFHNYRSLLEIHTDLLEKLHARQEEQHPRVGSVSDLIYDAALRWQDAIIEYGSHYPKAKYAWEQERRTNPKFATFLDQCRNASGTNRQDIGHFAYRPVPRLLRYTLLLKDILKHLTRTDQSDNLDIFTIPEVVELIDSQGKLIEKGVEESSAKVSLWQLPDSLSGGKFGKEIVNDLDLTNPMRELVHKGRLLRQPEGSIAASWSELHALLFNNFFVLTKLGKSKTSSNVPPRYYINRKPIPLELLTLGSFHDPPQSRRVGLLRTFRSERHESSTTPASDSESRTVYPFTFSFMGSGQLGGQYTLWADSELSRKEWQQKLLHAKALRSTVDNRELVAIGCAEGVWIGLRSDPRSLRKVLHVKAVTQCAVLEQFSLFLVLSNKTLLAYPMESLVPSSHSTGPPPRGHQKLSDKHEVQYFACGQLSGRTLVVYLRKKGLNSVFRCLEPITGREMDENRNRRAFTHFLNAKNDWFRVYKDFFVPSEAFHVHFLRNKLIVVCQKGFEIIDLTECFLLVYDTFGFFVDRHGYPNRDMRAIEWEGRPESVGFHPPYVVLFSAPFMEIRHISDGRLLQIYCAKDLRCSWDRKADDAILIVRINRSGTSANPEHGVPVPGPLGYTEDMISPEARLHIVQRADNSRGQPRNAISQDVYELCPTLLLNNPLRDLSTRDSTYFQPAPEVHYVSSRPSRS